MMLKVLALTVSLMATNALANCHEKHSELDRFLAGKGYSKLCYSKLPTKHAVIEVTLNGKKSHFILDSGANVSVVHQEALPKFRLIPTKTIDHSSATGIGGNVNTQTFSVESLKIKDLAIEHDVIVGMDLSHVVTALGSLTTKTIDGVIGQDILSKHQAIIDVASGTIYLK